MFKKFIFIFAFCMSIFCIPVFAADKISIPDYILEDIQTRGCDYGITYISSLKEYRVVLYDGDLNGTVYACYITNNGGTTWVTKDSSWIKGLSPTSAGLSLSNEWHYSSKNILNSDGSVFFSKQVIPIPTKPIAEVVQGSLAKIIPDLSGQLKILLLVGVILLSTMLGVSLVPRLVRLFL